MTDADFVGLAEVIRQVRGELEEARLDGDGHDLLFAVEKVSLEFAVQVHLTGNGRAGLRIGVVTAELGGSTGRDTTHRIQVELKPERRDGGRSVVGR
ncbi:trypco2 family protein [Peterkaempfera griseoplana]|uniref:trypco2 family protein n=1 Tax=Peterkaempfera griseoplana TaxID=66896 RepID=UPI0006E437DE|nr:trypco2 family protein [Peterkaempfera griseoplana]